MDLAHICERRAGYRQRIGCQRHGWLSGGLGSATRSATFTTALSAFGSVRGAVQVKTDDVVDIDDDDGNHECECT